MPSVEASDQKLLGFLADWVSPYQRRQVWILPRDLLLFDALGSAIADSGLHLAVGRRAAAALRSPVAALPVGDVCSDSRSFKASRTDELFCICCRRLQVIPRSFCAGLPDTVSSAFVLPGRSHTPLVDGNGFSTPVHSQPMTGHGHGYTRQGDDSQSVPQDVISNEEQAGNVDITDPR